MGGPTIGATVLALLAVVACGGERVDAADPAPAADPPAASVEPAAAQETIELAPGVTMAKYTPDGRPILTPMEFALVLVDPHDLDLEGRRKRSYARRKIIMNNPDGPAARVLHDLTEARRAGDIDVPGKGTTFHARGARPTSGRPPAGSRPRADPPSEPTP